MTDTPKTNQDPDDVRSEYAAVVEYHGTLVNSRFTIAGLYVAAMGFIASAVLDNDSSWGAGATAAVLACWLTVCLWVLELRSRALYTNLAHRGIAIEHRKWGLVGSGWYDGFFSRQYKEPPTEQRGEVVPRPGLDRPKIAWMKAPLSESAAHYVSHSWGLDLLYGGSGTFWIIVLVVSVWHLVFARGCQP